MAEWVATGSWQDDEHDGERDSLETLAAEFAAVREEAEIPARKLLAFIHGSSEYTEAEGVAQSCEDAACVHEDMTIQVGMAEMKLEKAREEGMRVGFEIAKEGARLAAPPKQTPRIDWEYAEAELEKAVGK